ncbi:sensor histidine kinase [Cohnella hongkongensis]|uniref:histidine kinase n=1 Tax=Cohnella hongkongensis TaxID=178337 RepID=A0ABV9F4E0_9BACL
MKLKTKMMWMIAMSVLIAVVALVAMIYAFNALLVTGYNHVKLQEMSLRLSERLEQAEGPHPERFARIFRQFDADYEDVDMELFDSDGKLLYASSDRTSPYPAQHLLARFANQPGRMFNGEDASLAYEITVGGHRYFVVFDVKGAAFQQVQFYLYLNRDSVYPFLIVPLILIVALPAGVAFVFILFVTRRVGRLSRAMRHADLREEPVRLQVGSEDEIGELTRLFNEMSEKLYRQYARIRQIEQSRTRLVRNLSHDLRTPLSIIQGYAETLQRGSAHDSVARVRHATIILQKSEYMNGLLHQLFRLAELDDVSKAFRLEQGFLPELLQSIVAEYVLILKDRDMTWNADIPEPFAGLNYDRDSLVQALRNLIDNALLHGGDGKFLGVRLRATDETAQIDIEDRGQGIPAGELDRIFERFYRVDKGRRSNGIGIGLSISNEIVQRHGGWISVRSVPNVSTVFTVHLPWKTEAAAASATPPMHA